MMVQRSLPFSFLTSDFGTKKVGWEVGWGKEGIRVWKCREYALSIPYGFLVLYIP